MKNKKRVVYIACCLIFFIFIYFLNDIILINEPYKIKKATKPTFDQRQPVGFGVDVIEAYTDIKQMISIQGWARLGNEEDDENRYIDLYFVSDNGSRTYQVSTSLHIRPDVNKEKKYGYITKFSSLNIAKGTYSLYIKVHENDNVEGFKKTGYHFVKNENGFSPYYPTEMNGTDMLEQAAPYVQLPNYETIYTSFEKIMVIHQYDDYLAVNGFFGIPNENPSSYTLYVISENEEGVKKAYPAFLYDRKEIADVMKSADTLEYGFMANIPSSALSNATTFYLVAEIDGQYYNILKDTYLNTKDKTYEKEIYLPQAYTALSEQDDEILQYYSLSLNDENFKVSANANVETFSVGEIEYTKLSGWAIDTQAKNTLSSLYIKMNGKYYKTKAVPRVDLTKEGNYQYLNAGYTVIIPTEELQNSSEVSFFAIAHDGTYRFQEQKLSIEK